MQKTFTILGKTFNPEKHRVNGWYMSEKLDGCKAMWIPNGEDRFSNDSVEPTGLWTRDGKVIHAPDWWLSNLPDTPLEGELYVSRQSFQETMSFTRKKTPINLEWKHVKFMICDMPVVMEKGQINFRCKIKRNIPDLYLHPTLSEQPIFKIVYEGYLKRLEENSVVKVVEQRKAKNKEEIKEFFDLIISKGGEGLMLRDPNSKWTQGRVDWLLKVKPVHSMDVIVTGYYYGDGKYDGMMGSLEVKGENSLGKTVYFKVSGFTEEERKIQSVGKPFSRSEHDDAYFKQGQIIKVKYRELSKDGIPKEARYSRCN